MNAIAVVFSMTVREAARRRILALAFGLGLAMLILFGVALWLVSQNFPSNVVMQRQVFKYLLTIGMYAVNILTVLMAVFISADSLAGEIRSGVIQTLASKPVRRSQILMGKWLAFAAIAAAYLGLIGGGMAGVVYLMSGFVPQHLPAAFGFMWLEAALLLSVTFLVGTRLSTLASGVAAIGLHGIAFLGGWIEEIGRVLSNVAVERIGIVTSLVFPSEALWRRAAYELQRPILMGLGGGPFSTTVVPSDWMALYAMSYALAVLALALVVFERRDL